MNTPINQTQLNELQSQVEAEYKATQQQMAKLQAQQAELLKGDGVSQEDATMAHGNVTDEELAELIRRAAEAASALIHGDIRTYLTLIKHAEGYTLMDPFGGEPTRGFDASSERLEAMQRFFQAGEAELELVGSYMSGDLVVLVVIERQHGQIGGLPDQDWSLRVTWVFRREGSEWRVVHRHADPLVHGISLDQLAALAHG